MNRTKLALIATLGILSIAANQWVFGSSVSTTPAAPLAPSGNPCTTGATITLTDAAIYYVDLEDCTGDATLTLNGAVSGSSYIIVVRQDGTASRALAWAAGTGTFKWPSGVTPTLTATANHEDAFSILYIAASGYLYGSVVQDYQD